MAMRNAQKAVVAVKDTIVAAVTNTSDFVAKLSLQQALIMMGLSVVGFSILSGMMIGFFKERLPGLYAFLIKMLLYFVMPSVAAGSTVFGMWLENRYGRYEEFVDVVQEKASDAHAFVGDMRAKVA